jgi:hypothetical protein
MLESAPDPQLVEVDFTFAPGGLAEFEPYRVQAFKSAASPERTRISLLWPDQGAEPSAVELRLENNIVTAALVTLKEDGWVFAVSMYLDVAELKYTRYIGPRAALRIMRLWRGEDYDLEQPHSAVMRFLPVRDIRTTFLHWPVCPEQIEKYQLKK